MLETSGTSTVGHRAYKNQAKRKMLGALGANPEKKYYIKKKDFIFHQIQLVVFVMQSFLPMRPR